MSFQLPKLQYFFDSLEPHINKISLENHYDIHNSYKNSLNTLVEGTDLQGKSIENLLKISSTNNDIRNYLGGYYNHNLFWTTMCENGRDLSDNLELSQAIKDGYGTYDGFKSAFKTVANNLVGNGWVWLCVYSGGKLEISSTENNDNPLMRIGGINKGVPILGLDMWEHSYYLQYQNKKNEYLEAFMNVINWEKINRKYCKEKLINNYEPIEITGYHRKRAKLLRSIIEPNGVGAEIGVYKGGLIRPILNQLKPEKLHLIDPWYHLGARWTWGKEDRSTMKAVTAILHTFEKELVNRQVDIHIGNDLKILPTFKNNYFDWVYLDTTHKYEQTKEELQILKQKVKKDGVIAGDDWYTEPNHIHFGVCKAVREFIQSEPYEMVLEDSELCQWAIKHKS